jgi:hypothetical protein
MSPLLVLCILTTIWAVVATIMVLRNPLPFPDRGHRAFGVPDERARQIVVNLLYETGSLKERWTFDSGPTHQTLLWDGFTVINHVDEAFQRERDLPSTAISLAVKDPQAAAQRAVALLTESGYKAEWEDNLDSDLPPNHLVAVRSDAFRGWLLVFRRPLIHMPRPKIRKN